ncbi:hypothetical protein ACHMW4_08020 [Mesorhizobium sp. UC22_110]|uniref:hypothetical protein n=1 Tax=Mesorhizobium sp. UC22_110 TaxID=3374552 RepID=UPI003756BB52
MPEQENRRTRKGLCTGARNGVCLCRRECGCLPLNDRDHPLRMRLKRDSNSVRFITWNIAAAWDDDANWLAGTFSAEILLEQFPQPACLHTHHGVSRRVESRILSKDIDCNGKALELVGLAGLFAFNKIAQQFARAF